MFKKMYLKEAAKSLGITPYYLRQMAKKYEIPCLKSGNRYIFDVDLCKKFLIDKAMKNVKKIENNEGYGTLRKVGCD